MSKLRRLFTSALMVMVVLSMGAFASVENTSASAQAGDLIKMDGLSAVYYLGADGKRYVFPNTSTFFSWYQDFSGVVTVSATELQSYPLGDNVTVRPGTYLVKITTDPKVYAVEPGGHLRWIQTEEDAIALYGADWASKVIDVPDSFFTNYTIVDPLEEGEYPAGQLLKNVDGSSIYYWDGEEFRKFASEAAFVANGFNFDHVVEVEGMTWEPLGDDITAYEDTFKIDFYVDATEPGVGTGLTVSLAADTPASQSIPQTVSRVPFTKVNFTASHDGAVNLESITVTRTGLTTYDTVRVWAEYDGMAITSKRTLTNDDNVILSVSPTLNIPAGHTKSVYILAELDNVGGNMALGISGAAHVVAGGATVSGSFPVTGNLMSLTTYNVTKIQIDETSSLHYDVNIGDEDVELGKFRVNLTEDQRDVLFNSITLRNTGLEDLDNVVMNLYLESSGERVSEYATFNGRYATFNLLDGGLTILRDDGFENFIMRGDIIGKDRVANVNSLDFNIHRSEHINIHEIATGFGVFIDTSTPIAVSEVRISSGDVAISKKSTSPSDKSVVASSNNILALIANIRVEEAIIADGIKVNHEGSDDYRTTFQNARVYLNNVLLDTFDLTNSSELIDTFIELNKGDNELRVTVDAKSSATSTNWVRFSLIGDGDLLDIPEYLNSGNPVEAGVFGGTATGAKIDIEGGELSVTRNDGFAENKVVVQGSENILFGRFAVRANNDDVRINSISLSDNNAVGTSTPSSAIYDMKLYVDGTQIGSTRNFSSGANFTSLNYTVPRDTTRVLELRGTLSSDAAGESGTHFRTTLSTNAQDSNGRAISVDNATTTEFKVNKSGDFIVDMLSDPVEAILASVPELNQEVARFEITSIDDSANLTEIEVWNWDGSVATSTSDPRIAAYKLYHGTTLIDEFVPVDGKGTFFMSNDVVIPANDTKTLSIKVELNNIVNDATATNKPLKVRINEIKYLTSAGQEEVDVTNYDANKFVIRKTVPTIARQSLGDTLLTAGEMAVAKFSVSADNNGSLKVEQFALRMGTTTHSTFATTTNPVKINGVNRSAIAQVSGNDMIITLASPEIISAGDTKTFEVFADVSNGGQSNQSITARILEDADYVYATEDVGDPSNISPSTFVWSDRASLTKDTWAGSKNVIGLPTTTWTLSNN